MHALHKLLRTLSLYQPYFVMMHVNEGCGLLVHGNNGLQMRMFFHHVLYVHLIEMNNPSFLACFQPCGICSILLILCLKKMIKWTWKSWCLQPRYQMHCKSDPTSPFLLGREYNNCILSLELPVKSPSLSPLIPSFEWYLQSKNFVKILSMKCWNLACTRFQSNYSSCTGRSNGNVCSSSGGA
jgi:hypothetical protein